MRSRLRRFVDLFRRTPFHPQWLLVHRKIEVEVIRTRAFGTVLDVGCFDCWVREHLPPDSRYIGLDYPATGIALYQSHPDVFADASELPLDDNCIDTVVMFQTLEHVARPAEALSESHRVLRCGGVLLLSVPFLYPLHDEPYDFTRLTSHGLRMALENAGFSVNMIKPTLGSAETAGLTVCLSLSGMSLIAIKERSFSLIFVPLAVAAIPFVNLCSWLLAKTFPTWDAISAGYIVVAHK